MAELDDLGRALMAGDNSRPGPLHVESLEATLRTVTYDASKVKLWRSDPVDTLLEAVCPGDEDDDK